MKIRIDEFIEGIPYCKDKVSGDLEAPKRWNEAVRLATKHSPKVKGKVSINLKFILPPNKYPLDCPYGPDLDNLLKPFLDAIGTTILSEVPSKDGAVVRLSVTKRRALKGETAGVRMILNELQTKPIRPNIRI